MKNWDLTKLYKSFDDLAFKNDKKRLLELIEKITEEELSFSNYDNKKSKLVKYLKNEILFNTLAIKLMAFSNLTMSCESTNLDALKNMNFLQMNFTRLAKINTIFEKWLMNYPQIDNDISNNNFLKEHEFFIKEIIKNASHNLDDSTESLLLKLKQNSSFAWSRLQSLLTSTLTVSYNGKDITLSEVRNLAHDKDPSVRKAAFEAEIAGYKKIEKPIAFALNSIKGEVNVITEERGYDSALLEALSKSRMNKETLNAMQSAVKDYLEIFRKYLKRKAKLLGHENGLPFYELFAPIGKTSSKFTIKEANEYILKNFKTFSEELYEMADKAFKNNWVDYNPKKGKVGGAFCYNLHPIKESRILTNFTGAFSDMITLSHELGHAFHGENIFNESILNADYTMPVAETASIFCETIVNKAALKDAANDEERIFLLESSLQGYTQVIVDIMSRFIFEQKVFEGRKETIFDELELKDIMIQAQKETYGDGLDQNQLHPYMWVCKSHYYSGDLSYYNFPYTFGLLFAKGLYAKYLEDKDSFVKLYYKLLASTGKMSVEDVAKIADIDVTKKKFWISSLELIKEDINTFLELTK